MKVIPLEIMDMLGIISEKQRCGQVKSGLDIYGSVLIKSRRGVEYALLNNSGEKKQKGGKRYIRVMPVCIIRGDRVSVAEIWKDQKTKSFHLRKVMTGKLPKTFMAVLKKRFPGEKIDIQIYKTFSGKVPWSFHPRDRAIALKIPYSIYRSLKGRVDTDKMVYNEEECYRMIVGLDTAKSFSIKQTVLTDQINKNKAKVAKTARGRCPRCGSTKLENGYGYAAGYGMGKYRFCSKCGAVCDFCRSK